MPTFTELVAGTSQHQFEAAVRDTPLVIIYPRNRGRSALIALFLDHYKQDFFYYSLGTADTTLNAWLGHLIDSEVMPAGFGSQTRAALSNKADPEMLAEALGADLATIKRKRFVLLLDMFDRLKPGRPVSRFFTTLARHIPSHVQIAIHARLLDLNPWNELIHEGLASVVGNEDAMGGGIYGDEPKKGQLEVFALSGGHVYSNGQPVTSWDGSLPKHLFYYFVDHPMVTRDEIFSVFWPGMSIKEATNVFHVTKRKISERLGFELTSYQGGFYIPSPKIRVHYDARLFENAVHEAIETERDAPAQWYTAVWLYRSEFLPYLDTPWVNERRQELKHKYAQALIGLGRYYRGLNELDQALGYLLRALREKPDWEDVHQDVIMIYTQQGRIDDAVRQYKQLELTLKRMFNIAPSKETRRLYDVITAV